MGGLGSGPSLKMEGGGLSERPLTGKTGDFGTKNNKETHLLKRVSFRSDQVGKTEQRVVYF